MEGRVCVATGTRAEFGLLRPLIDSLSQSEDFQLSLVVTGMHLSEKHGSTYKEIEEAGFKIDAKVDCEIGLDSAEAISNSIGKGIIGFSKVFEELDPELLIILGDRTEILAAAIAALIKGTLIAHLHGGELTEGAYDESIRHSITKMSHIHFTSNEVYRNRVIQLGEDPTRAFNVGAIGLDSIKNLTLLEKSELEKQINFTFGKRNLLITFHPVTLEDKTSAAQFQELLNALEKLEETKFIFTYPNSDKDGRPLIDMIDRFVDTNKENSISFKSMGQLKYLSTVKLVDMVVGNSSSGIIEVPYFGKPTINIGDRQKGRLSPKSVINCDPIENEISRAIDLAFSKNFLGQIENQENHYGSGDTTIEIMAILKKINIETSKKKFF